MHSHHLRPREYGGDEDGAQIALCPTCHDRLHDYFRLWLKGDLDVSLFEFDTLPRWKRAIQLIIDQYKIFQRSGGKLENRGNVGLKLTREEQDMLNFIQAHAPGRPSKPDVIKALIRAKYARIRSGLD